MDLAASKEDLMNIHLMLIEENRVNSFKDWVFNDDGCACSPKKVGVSIKKVMRGSFE